VRPPTSLAAQLRAGIPEQRRHVEVYLVCIRIPGKDQVDPLSADTGQEGDYI
jgi:hypothetical protein